MKCLADEGVDRMIVDKLREAGHEVLYIGRNQSSAVMVRGGGFHCPV